MRHRSRSTLVLTGVGLALATASGLGTAAASPEAPPDTVTVFASVPYPGHPFGIAVEGDRVYVSTSAGDFFADPANGGHKHSDGEAVLTYDLAGTLLSQVTIPTMVDATMGLFGIALDGNVGADHRLYVADMNGRILRPDPSDPTAEPELFAQTTIEGGWQASMWNDLTFDTAGNLYVPDDKPRIWRVTPDGTVTIWVTDPRLATSRSVPSNATPQGEWVSPACR